VIDAEGKKVHFVGGGIDPEEVWNPKVDVTLAPGKEIKLGEMRFEIKPAREIRPAKDTALYGTGKFQIQYKRVFEENSSAGLAGSDVDVTGIDPEEGHPTVDVSVDVSGGGIPNERVSENASARGITLDPTLSKLATGKLDLEIKPAPPATAKKK
jgi:hypothetical protein